MLTKIHTLLGLYKHMVASRETDIVEFELVNSGEANFLATSKGHEGTVILNPFLIPSDWIHAHYRDKALLMARGVSTKMFFYSALAKAESHSCGRQMVSHMSAPELNVMSIVGPVGNSALQAAGVAYSIKDNKDNPIVICSFGDGTSQQGEVLEAIAEAKRSHLPVLFFIQNNELAISTRTKGKTFFSIDDHQVNEFMGIPITYIDGINPFMHYDLVGQIISKMRTTREPQIIVFNVDRLDNHSNADDQKLYRKEEELNQSKLNDPLITSYNYLLQQGISAQELEKIKQDAIAEVRASLELAKLGTEPKAIFDAYAPLPEELKPLSTEYRGTFGQDGKRYTMLESMRHVFDMQLNNDPNVILIGQDIEDGKGDVFGITRGLSTRYPNRVLNSALSESTIVGVAVGMALTGKKPVAFVQFADFMPLAYNQIYSELATMYWRTNGGWQSPVIIFAACGGYRPGLGPFHSQTNESTYAHIPGIDVYIPSNAADAAGMLNAAFKSNRPSMFLYPKKLLNNLGDKDTASTDINNYLIPIGKARIERSGTDITLVGYGNTVALCVQAADILENDAGISAEIIDLRTIKPYDLNTILASVEKTKNLIVTHEDNITCSISSDIIASVIERVTKPIQARRVTKADTHTPCNFANQLEVLPSYEKILVACGELLNLEVKFEVDDHVDDTLFNVEVIGASPSDESVLINKLHVRVGDKVNKSDTLVDIEASKSAGEILSPCSGIVEEICVIEGERATVGALLLKIRLTDSKVKVNNKTKKVSVSRKLITNNKLDTNTKKVTRVGMSIPIFKTGSRAVSTDEIVVNFPEYSSADIIQRTGIENRYWLAPDEKIVDIAAKIAIEALQKHNLTLGDINLIICATCSPDDYLSPSMACLILEKLYATYGEHIIPAYDSNAACSGYLYGLSQARDYLQTRPNERVLLITAENLSKRLDMNNFDTAFLFGDAATATILFGDNHINQAKLLLDQITLSAIGENGSVLNIPVDEKAGITLQGKKLFTIAVKTMSLAMNKCCVDQGILLTDMDFVVPHQANQRILNAVEHRLKLPKGFIYSNIAKFGNTSSCTIPIGLSEILPITKTGNIVGLCAFGGGFTAGAAILTVL